MQVAFDIETTRPFHPGEAPGSRPIGILVIAVASQDTSPRAQKAFHRTGEPQFSLRVWHPPLPSDTKLDPEGKGKDRGKGGAKKKKKGTVKPLQAQLQPHQVCAVVEHLYNLVVFKHAQLCTWGGMAADWPVLAACCAHSPEHVKMVLFMAWHHVDLPFTLLCHRGYMVGLGSVARHMGLDIKPVHSKSCSDLWVFGTATQVIHLCTSDAVATLRIIQSASAKRTLQWKNTAGRVVVWRLPGSSVAAAMGSRQPWVMPNTMQAYTLLPPPRFRWDKPITPRTSCQWAHNLRGETCYLSKDPFQDLHVFGHGPTWKKAAKATATNTTAAKTTTATAKVLAPVVVPCVDL